MSDSLALVIALFLLGANAFFVGAEFSLISARRDRLESMADRGVHRARAVIRASEQLSRMLAAAQLGITIASLGLGSLGEPAVAHQLEKITDPIGMPSAVMHTIAFVIALGIVTVAHILLGEMVPKNIAIAGPEPTSLWLVPPLVGFARMTGPVIAILNWVANQVLRLFHVEPKDELESAYTPGELANLIADSSHEGLLDQEEHRRLTQTLSTVERTVADVLVPTDQVRAVPARPVLADVEQAVADTGFSRFPLRENGDFTGYLHVKDVIPIVSSPPETSIPTELIRSLPLVSTGSKLDDALARMRRARSHLARVVDADGLTVGVIAMEDLLEEYVGAVRDDTHVPRSTP